MLQLATLPELKEIEVGKDDIAGLRTRLNLSNDLIAMMRSSSDGDEVRTAQCIENLTNQQREINRRLVAAIKAEREQSGEDEPQPVLVNLKPINMGMKAPRR